MFICPPDLTALKKRLSERGTESEESVQKRLHTAHAEIEYAKTGAHDMILVNDDLETAYSAFERIALGESIPSIKLPLSFV